MAVASFYRFHARHGARAAGVLRAIQAPGRGYVGTAFRPFLHHVAGRSPQPRLAVKVKAPRPLPRVLTVAEAQSILDACGHLRDRLLLAMMLEAGLRIGEALGMRHEDVDIGGCLVRVVPRDNANGMRAKGGRGRAIPAGAPLMRLYADYLNRGYGAVDSDYVLSRHPDNTYCPEPGVIWILCLEFASDQPLFAGEVRIIFWLYRIVINRVRYVTITLSASTGGKDDRERTGPGCPGSVCRRFTAWLAARGYAPSTVDKQLTLMGRLGRWLESERIPLNALDDDTVRRFTCSVRSSGRTQLSIRGVMPVLEYLRSTGAVPPEPSSCISSPRQLLLLAYERYLSGERSLGQSTIVKYSRIAGAFMDRLPDPAHDALAGLSAVQVHGFVLSRTSGARSGCRAVCRRNGCCPRCASP